MGVYWVPCDGAGVRQRRASQLPSDWAGVGEGRGGGSSNLGASSWRRGLGQAAGTWGQAGTRGGQALVALQAVRASGGRRDAAHDGRGTRRPGARRSTRWAQTRVAVARRGTRGRQHGHTRAARGITSSSSGARSVAGAGCCGVVLMARPLEGPGGVRVQAGVHAQCSRACHVAAAARRNFKQPWGAVTRGAKLDPTCTRKGS